MFIDSLIQRLVKGTVRAASTLLEEGLSIYHHLLYSFYLSICQGARITGQEQIYCLHGCLWSSQTKKMHAIGQRRVEKF